MLRDEGRADRPRRPTRWEGVPLSERDVLREHGFHRLAVKRVVEETADTRSFVLDVPAELADVFRYRAGQFCTFRVRLGDEELLRSYSMSSAPETDPDLTVTVKRVPGGRVSNWFNDCVAVGHELEVTKPAGVFCVGDGDRPVVAFAGGSGITPVLSITKSVLAATDRPVRLLYANRDRASVIFHDEVARLGGAHAGRLEVRHHLDDDAGFLDAGDVEAFLAGGTDADVFVCGPAPFMELVERTLVGAGVAPERIAIERFGDAPTPAPAPAAVAGVGAEVPASVTVILKGRRHEIDYRPGDTLLETARRGGLQAPFSCQAGDCATCMALLHEGSARMRTNNALTPEEVAEGWVLTCQALPEGPAVTVEYESL